MDVVERERLRKVSDKLMRQFAPAVSTLVADEEEEEDALIEQPVFVERIRAVFSNLSQRKPDLAEFLLEERNFEHYCLSLWHKYCGVDKSRFDEFLDNWQESEPVSGRTSLVTSDLSLAQSAEAKAAEDALLTPPLEGRTSENPSTSSPLTELVVVSRSSASSPVINEELTISDPIKPQPEDDFWSAPAPEIKGGLMDPKAAAEEMVSKPVSEKPVEQVSESASKPPETPKDAVNARLAMMLADLEDEDDVASPNALVSTVAAPLPPKPVEEIQPVVQAQAPPVAPEPETSLQLYRRLIKDMAARECFTMDQLKFLLRMRTEKGISEQEHMGVLSDLGISPALFAQYIKNGQKGWSKPVVAGAALLSIVMDLAARLVAAEDPTEQAALARELVDAKRAVDEDRKANNVAEDEDELLPEPVKEERKSANLGLAPFSAALPIAATVPHSSSNGTIVLVPVHSPSSSSSSSAISSSSSLPAYAAPPPAYNPALSSSTSLFTSSIPSSTPTLTQRTVSVPAVTSSPAAASLRSGSVVFQGSSVPSSPTTTTSSASPSPQRKPSLVTPSTAPPPPPQRTSLFSAHGASAIASPASPASPSSASTPVSGVIPQRPSLFSAHGASAAPPPPLRIPSTPFINQPIQQASPLSQVRNGSLTPSSLPMGIVVQSVAAGGTLPRSSSNIQIQTPSSPVPVQRNLSLISNNGSVSPLASSPSGSSAMNRSPSSPALVHSSSGVFDPPPPAYDPPPYGAPPPGYGAPPSYNVATASPTAAAPAPIISKDGREYWTIITPVRIRDAPSTTGNPIGKLDPGSICVSTQRQGSWFKHSQGWSMYESDGKILAQSMNPDTLVAYQPTITLRIRSAPLATAPEVGFLHPGQTVLALEIQGFWLRHELGWSMITSDPAAKGEKKTFLQKAGPRVVDPCNYYEALLQVRIRQQPAADGKELGVLSLGQVVRCLEIQGSWLRHEAGWSLMNGEVKGQKTNFLQPTSPPSEGKQKPFYEVVHPLRVRSAPSATAPEVTILELGQKIKCLEIQGFWLRHDMGWSMIHSDPSKGGDRKVFLQQVAPSSPSPSPSSSPPASPASSGRVRPQLESPRSQSNIITFEVVSPAGLRVRDSPSDKGKEVCLLQPGQTIVGTEIQGSWVRHALGWSLIMGEKPGKKGEKVMFLKPK